MCHKKGHVIVHSLFLAVVWRVFIPFHTLVGVSKAPRLYGVATSNVAPTSSKNPTWVEPLCSSRPNSGLPQHFSRWSLARSSKTCTCYTKSPAPAWLLACTTTSSGERGSPPIVNSAGTCPVPSATAQLIANSMKPNNSHYMSSDKFLSANKQWMAYLIVQCIRSVLPSV